MSKGTVMVAAIALGSLGAYGAAAQTMGTARPEAVGMSGKQLALIHDSLRIHIASGQITGGLVLVARDGKVVYTDAQGKVGDQPIKIDSIYSLASTTKPFIAVAAMMMVEEGKINLDDPIAKYIPELGGPKQMRVLDPGSPPAELVPFPGTPKPPSLGVPRYHLEPVRTVVTVRHLLTQTSGLQNFKIPYPAPPNGPGETLATRIPKFAGIPMEFEPGTQWVYSNAVAVDVLGRIVEVASGQPLDKFLQTRILDPLAMKDTAFGVRRASLSRALPLFPGPVGQIPVAENTTYFSGSGGLWSTASDYARFAQMLLNGGTYDGHRFLKPETVAAMTSNQIGGLDMLGYAPMAMQPEGVKFGYGLLTVTHSGWAGIWAPVGSFGWDGVGTRRWWAAPANKTVIVMMATGLGPMAGPFHRDVEALVASSVTTPSK